MGGDCITNAECQNGGRCVHTQNEADHYQPASSAGRYDDEKGGMCHCQKGFSGIFCEEGTLDTSCKTDAECKNGGTCRTSTGQRNQDRHDIYQHNAMVVTHCVCRDGYVGAKCQIPDYAGTSINENPMRDYYVIGIPLMLFIVGTVGLIFFRSRGGHLRRSWSCLPTKARLVGIMTRGSGDGIYPSTTSTTTTGLGRRRGASTTTRTSSTIEIGQVFVKSPNEML